MHNFVPSVCALFWSAKQRYGVELSGSFGDEILVVSVLIEFSQSEFVSDLFVFLKFGESLFELGLSGFLNAIMEIAVLQHFFKFFFWNLECLAFRAFALCC